MRRQAPRAQELWAVVERVEFPAWLAGERWVAVALEARRVPAAVVRDARAQSGSWALPFAVAALVGWEVA
jgi:hypothetical protein